MRRISISTAARKHKAKALEFKGNAAGHREIARRMRQGGNAEGAKEFGQAARDAKFAAKVSLERARRSRLPTTKAYLWIRRKLNAARKAVSRKL